MIHYATDSNARLQIYVWLMALAIGVQLTISRLLVFFDSVFGRQLAAPTAIAIFWVLMLAYENYIWKGRILGFPLSTIPNFSGAWVGYIEKRSEYIAHGDVFVLRTRELLAVHLYIKQTFSKISIRVKSITPSQEVKAQESEATTAGIFCQDFAHPKLKYTWSRQDLSGEGEFLLKEVNSRPVLEGRYSSIKPRFGFMSLTKWEAGDSWYCGKLSVIKNQAGRAYLAVYIPEPVVLRELDAMKSFLGDEIYEAYRQNQNSRDQGSFHMTVIDPAEVLEIAAPALDLYEEDTWLWIQVLGLGRQAKESEETLYAVVACDGAQHVRTRLNLGNKDLHVTLGFKGKDIYSVPKGRTTIISFSSGRSLHFNSEISSNNESKARFEPPDGLL